MEDSLDELFAGSGYSQDFVSREFIDNNDNANDCDNDNYNDNDNYCSFKIFPQF